MGFSRNIPSKLNVSDIDKTREKVKIGDTVKYPLVTYDLNKECCFTKRLVPAVVIKKFRVLAQVKLKGEHSEIPIRTISYAQIEATKRGIHID